MSEIEYGDWMSETDALMWHMERDPILRSTITTVWVLDEMPDEVRLRASLDKAVATIPRLSQRVVADPVGIAPPRWEFDPLFDPDYHIRRGRLGGSGDLRDLFDHAAPIAAQAFDKDRPLWEFHLLDAMADGRVGVVMKLHHTIGDGVGLVDMAGALMDLSRDPPDEGVDQGSESTVPLPPGKRSSTGSQLRRAIQHQAEAGIRRTVGGAAAVGRGAIDYARDPVGSSKSIAETASSIARALRPVSTPLSPIMVDRSMSAHFDAFTTDVERLKAAAKVAGGTLNDAYVAAMLGGLARYHRHHDAMVDELRMTMPINVRAAGDLGGVAGNSFAPARFAVPLGIDDPVARMQAVAVLVKQQRAEPAYGRVGQISTALFSLGPAVFTPLTGALLKAIDFVTSNVPGPPCPVFVSGARIERLIGFGPLSGSGMNATLYGYDGIAEIGIATDPAAVPDPDLLVECLIAGIDEVLAVA